MTGRADDYERTMAFAEIALGQMKALRQPATARNYEIWYTYATGVYPALNQQVNATIRAKGTISEADLTQIYDHYLSPVRLTERIDEVGSQIMGEIDQVMAMIDAAAGSASSYTESLVGATEQLGQSKDREGLRAIVESLVQTTKSMERSNKQLEERLVASKREINELQENLEVVRTESLTDPLTQLANRKFFDATLEKSIADAFAKDESLADSHRHRPLQELQRQLWPPDRRSGFAPCRGVSETQRQGQGHRSALRWRGVCDHSAEYATARGGHCC